ICASVQSRIVSILLDKLEQAARETQVNYVAIAGGVSANSGLRNALLALGEKLGWSVFIRRVEYRPDHAAMIAIAGYHKYLTGDFASQEVAPLARWQV